MARALDRGVALAGTACLVLLVLELILQLAFYVRYGHAVFQDDPLTVNSARVFERHPYLVVRPRANARVINSAHDKTITITAQHTRWTGAPEDDGNAIRVAVLGGSSAFGTRVSDAESWPAQLQARLGPGYSVRNYGVPGYSTTEAIIQLSLLVPEWQPEVVVLYQGWNDIRNYHDPGAGADYYGSGMAQYASLGLPVAGTSALDRLGAVSAIGRLVRELRLRLGPPAPAAESPRDDPDPFVDRVFVRNLRTLKALAEHLGADTIFVPQVLNYASFKDRSDADWLSPHIRNGAMPVLMDRFNTLMATCCPPGESSCVFLGEVEKLPWEDGDFVDHGHFSRSGGAKLVDRVGETILARHPTATAPPP